MYQRVGEQSGQHFDTPTPPQHLVENINQELKREQERIAECQKRLEEEKLKLEFKVWYEKKEQLIIMKKSDTFAQLLEQVSPVPAAPHSRPVVCVGACLCVCGCGCGTLRLGAL